MRQSTQQFVWIVTYATEQAIVVGYATEAAVRQTLANYTADEILNIARITEPTIMFRAID